MISYIVAKNLKSFLQYLVLPKVGPTVYEGYPAVIPVTRYHPDSMD